MRNKIIGIVICMLMIVTIFPVVGFPIQTGEVNSEHTKKAAATMENIVISMLEQVDETIYLRYLENLTAFGPRHTGSDACEAAADYIYNQFESMGLTVRYHHWKNSQYGYSSDNIEATINGTDESSDEIYIICAHYDTVAAGLGADDDASGTVAVLMAAFIMSQYHYKFNHTIKFVAFSGEEQGLLGSKAYSAEAVDKGWNIVSVLNADMISYAVKTSDGNNLLVFEDTASEWLYTYTFNINTEYADYIHLTLHHGGIYGHSDHWYFWVEGYSALFYFEYVFTPYYHTSGDTIVHINATYAVKSIRLILATFAELSEVESNNPPNTPTITGETNGDIQTSYNYTIQTNDSDQDKVKYFIDWGDNNNTITSLNASEVEVIVSHTWDIKGTYNVKVKAIDEHNAESDWATLTVTMPSSYDKPIPQFLELLFHRFPNSFPLLRQLMGY